MNKKRRDNMKYGSYRPHGRVRTEVATGTGRARQEFAAECDVNTIMRKYGRTGILPTHDRQMQYGDFTNLPDFMTAMNVVSVANEAFAALPANVRKRFGNDPAEFVEFVSDPENIDAVRKMGLAKMPETPKPGTKEVPAAGPAAGGSQQPTPAPAPTPSLPPTASLEAFKAPPQQ